MPLHYNRTDSSSKVSRTSRPHKLGDKVPYEYFPIRGNLKLTLFKLKEALRDHNQQSQGIFRISCDLDAFLLKHFQSFLQPRQNLTLRSLSLLPGVVEHRNQQENEDDREGGHGVSQRTR